MRGFPIDVTLLHQREGGSHLTPSKLDDLLISHSLLVQELGARKCNHLYPILTILLVYVHKLNIALVGEGSLRSNVNDNCQFEAFH